jgi:hypothetical protein
MTYISVRQKKLIFYFFINNHLVIIINVIRSFLDPKELTEKLEKILA